MGLKRPLKMMFVLSHDNPPPQPSSLPKKTTLTAKKAIMTLFKGGQYWIIWGQIGGGGALAADDVLWVKYNRIGRGWGSFS